ncbi:MAG TPA: aminotransferase class I/II-fold pyridoxal phosphate-dependent enzyme [Candidatus Dormibacteraeota bacterium]|nr:aminotransferase class I/II-fold pyridoxal phosphate-dependent enzyme [Candidatus Dormibacteraeota bacterium]
MTAMRIADFALERYFARWEFAVRHVLGASDVEPWPVAELLELADDETRAMWDGLRLGYTESSGHPLLRREIASLYPGLEADDVLVFAGAEEAIFCLASTLVGPGDHVIVTWPGYQSLYEVARASGAQVALHALRESDGWSLDVPRLLRSLRPTTRLVIVNAPHNPTGMLPTTEEWRTLVAALEDAGVHLLADEVYRGLEVAASDRLPTAAELVPRGISLGVMSKAYAMAGLRIGWLATRDRDVLARCAAMKDYTTICSSAPSEVLALIGLRAGDTVLARSRSICAANLARLDAFLEGRPDVMTWVRPRGGSIGFPRLLGGRSADAFVEALVREEGVLLVPGSAFGYAGDHLRIGFGRADLPEALARLEAFLDRTA